MLTVRDIKKKNQGVCIGHRQTRHHRLLVHAVGVEARYIFTYAHDGKKKRALSDVPVLFLSSKPFVVRSILSLSPSPQKHNARTLHLGKAHRSLASSPPQIRVVWQLFVKTQKVDVAVLERVPDRAATFTPQR